MGPELDSGSIWSDHEDVPRSGLASRGQFFGPIQPCYWLVHPDMDTIGSN